MPRPGLDHARLTKQRFTVNDSVFPFKYFHDCEISKRVSEQTPKNEQGWSYSRVYSMFQAAERKTRYGPSCLKSPAQSVQRTPAQRPCVQQISLAPGVRSPLLEYQRVLRVPLVGETVANITPCLRCNVIKYNVLAN